MNRPYALYIDGLEIPITPSKITNKIDGQNDVYNLINGEHFTAIRKSKLQEYEFSFYAFSREHPGVDVYTPQEEIIKKLEELKKDKKEFEFVILRTPSDPNLRNSICKHMTLEDYKINEDTKHGTHILIDISLKEYQPLKTVKLEDKGNINGKRQVYKREVIKAAKNPMVMIDASLAVTPQGRKNLGLKIINNGLKRFTNDGK